MATHRVHSKTRFVIILTTLITALLIVLSGLLWILLVQNKQNNSAELSSLTPQQSSQSESVSSGSDTSKDDSSKTDSSSSKNKDDISSSETNSKNPTQSAKQSETESTISSNIIKNSDKIVPKSEKANASYLDDAVFIGDSISVSLSLYQALPAKNVIATQNVNTHQVVDGQEVFSTPKGKVSLKTALKGKNPKKIYVMLGANGMNSWSNEKQIEYFDDLLDQLESWYPDAIIYVESMTPVSSEKNKKDKNINNASITDYNKRLLKLVEGRSDNIYYLNVAEDFTTKYGNLKSEYNGGDGLHFSPKAARAVVSYALTHTVQ